MGLLSFLLFLSRNLHDFSRYKPLLYTPLLFGLTCLHSIPKISNMFCSGWVVEYLVTIRHGQLSKIGFVPAGSYAGIFLGRLFLAEPTHRFGERRMLLLYAGICLVLQLLFWLVPSLTSSIIMFSIMGFFLGPFFAAVSGMERNLRMK